MEYDYFLKVGNIYIKFVLNILNIFQYIKYLYYISIQLIVNIQ